MSRVAFALLPGQAPDGGTTRFSLERGIRGVSEPEVTIAGYGAGSNCEYTFQPGGRYVVYARRDARTNVLATSICSRTGPVGASAVDLAYFDTLARPATGGRVYGSIHHFEMATTGPLGRGPLRGLQLHLRGAGADRSITTDDVGGFEFAGVRPGSYVVRAVSPRHSCRGGGSTSPSSTMGMRRDPQRRPSAQWPHRWPPPRTR